MFLFASLSIDISPSFLVAILWCEVWARSGGLLFVCRSFPGFIVVLVLCVSYVPIGIWFVGVISLASC